MPNEIDAILLDDANLDEGQEAVRSRVNGSLSAFNAVYCWMKIRGADPASWIFDSRSFMRVKGSLLLKETSKAARAGRSGCRSDGRN